MNTRDHPLFAKAPLRGEVTLSTGLAPVPYHVYDGHGLVLLGSCDGTGLDAAFAGQDVHPVLTRAGRGVLVVFVCDFPDASHGAHNELHITALAADTAGQVLPDDPTAALAALATQPDWGLLSLHLWNDSADVVAYNTEYLGLDALQLRGQITRETDRLHFAFTDTQGAALAAGAVRMPARSDSAVMGRVLRHLGLRGLWRAMMRKTQRAHLINRKSDVIARNGRALTLTHPDKMVVSAFDPAKDRFDAAAGPSARLGFTPLLAQHLWPFRFVYLHPDDS